MQEFTQDEVNRIVKQRLEREKRKLDRELEDARSSVYSELPDYKSRYIDALKRKSLLDAGLPVSEVDRYLRYIDDSDEVEVVQRQARDFVEELGKDKRKSYADPSQKTKADVWKPF